MKGIRAYRHCFSTVSIVFQDHSGSLVLLDKLGLHVLPVVGALTCQKKLLHLVHLILKDANCLLEFLTFFRFNVLVDIVLNLLDAGRVIEGVLGFRLVVY